MSSGTQLVAVLAGDLPFVTADAVRQLLDVLADRPDVDAALALDDDAREQTMFGYGASRRCSAACHRPDLDGLALRRLVADIPRLGVRIQVRSRRPGRTATPLSSWPPRAGWPPVHQGRCPAYSDPDSPRPQRCPAYRKAFFVTSGVFDPSAPSGAPAARPRGMRERHVTDYAELSRRVKDAGLLNRRPAATRPHRGLLGAFVGVWVGLGLLGDSWFQLVLAAAARPSSLAQFGFLGHDAAHRQVFASHAANEWIVAGAVRRLHRAELRLVDRQAQPHHDAPNQIGSDPDIESAVLAFTAQARRARRSCSRLVHQAPGLVLLPAAPLEGVNLHVAEHRAC